MVVTVLAIYGGTVHRVMVHGDDPWMFGSLSWLVRLLQVLLQPAILLPDQIQTIPDKEIELRVNGNDMSWTNIPAMYTHMHAEMIEA